MSKSIPFFLPTRNPSGNQIDRGLKVATVAQHPFITTDTRRSRTPFRGPPTRDNGCRDKPFDLEHHDWVGETRGLGSANLGVGDLLWIAGRAPLASVSEVDLEAEVQFLSSLGLSGQLILDECMLGMVCAS